jgi:hypothetical protein
MAGPCVTVVASVAPHRPVKTLPLSLRHSVSRERLGERRQIAREDARRINPAQTMNRPWVVDPG